jgi:hypothetical protein
VYPAKFDYHAASTLDEASSLLDHTGIGNHEMPVGPNRVRQALVEAGVAE